jgi:mxaJ protein
MFHESALDEEVTMQDSQVRKSHAFLPPLFTLGRPLQPLTKAALAATCLLPFLTQGPAQAQDWEMRVCAEPNNLPYSNEREEGFENRIAEIVAHELHAKLTYVWLPQHQSRATVGNVLNREGECDMIMGITDGHSGFLTSAAYYRTSFVFVYRKDSPFVVRSLDDPVLRELQIGVHVQAGGLSPGTHALLNRGLIRNQVGFTPDHSKPTPLSPIVEAVAEGEVDVAIVWGPVAGYFAEQQPIGLELVPVTPEIDLPIMPMVFPISIGVRPGDEALRDALNVVLARRWDEIQAILEEYGMPLLQLPKPVVETGGP